MNSETYTVPTVMITIPLPHYDHLQHAATALDVVRGMIEANTANNLSYIDTALLQTVLESVYGEAGGE